MKRQKIVILGLSITSSWGNGHASTYRGLAKDCGRAAHVVSFSSANRNGMPRIVICRVRPIAGSSCIRALENSRSALGGTFGRQPGCGGLVRPEGAAIGCWVTSTAEGSTAFYDIDTPVTLHAWRERS